MHRLCKPVRIAGLVLLTGLIVLGLIAYKGRKPVARAYYFAPDCPARVALTFETLWSDDGLAEVLQALETEQIQATFFMTTQWLQRYPEGATAILRQGHEIGNRAFSHLLPPEGTEPPRNEIGEFIAAAGEMLEYRPVLFRPAGSGLNTLPLETVCGEGCRTVYWSVDSYDWISLSGAEIAFRVSERVHGGAIINFRVGARFLPAALPLVARALREQGYETVTVSALLAGRSG